MHHPTHIHNYHARNDNDPFILTVIELWWCSQIWMKWPKIGQIKKILKFQKDMHHSADIHNDGRN